MVCMDSGSGMDVSLRWGPAGVAAKSPDPHGPTSSTIWMPPWGFDLWDFGRCECDSGRVDGAGSGGLLTLFCSSVIDEQSRGLHCSRNVSKLRFSCRCRDVRFRVLDKQDGRTGRNKSFCKSNGVGWTRSGVML